MRSMKFLVLVPVLLSGCADQGWSVRYNGATKAPPRSPADLTVFRATVPNRPYRDLGTVTVTCPTTVEAAWGTAQTSGGCYYAGAVSVAAKRAAQAGADGLYAIDTSVAGNGMVVSLNATAFQFTGQAPSEPPQGAPAQTVEERLARLQKLRDGGLITPEDFERRKAEILKDL